MQKETASEVINLEEKLEEKLSHVHTTLRGMSANFADILKNIHSQNDLNLMLAKGIALLSSRLAKVEKFWDGLPCSDAFRLVLQASLQSLSSLSSV